jgi:hypothetical protein
VWASIWLLILLPGTLELGLLIFAVLGYLSNPPFSVVSLDISSRDAIRLSRQAQVIAMVVKSNYRLPSPKVAGVAAIALTITILDALPAVAVCSNDFLIGEDLRGPFTVRPPTSEQKALSEAEMPMAQSARSVLSVRFSTSYAVAGCRHPVAKPDGAWKSPCGLPSSEMERSSLRRASPM